MMIAAITATTPTDFTTPVISADLGAVVVLVLVLLLALKELISPDAGEEIAPRLRFLVRSLDVAIVPMLLAFILSVILKILGML